MSVGAIVGGVVAAAGAVTASVIGAKAASGAAKTQAAGYEAGAAQAAQIQMKMFEKFQQTLKPYVNTGLDAMTELKDLLGIGEDREILTYQGIDATPEQIKLHEQMTNRGVWDEKNKRHFEQFKKAFGGNVTKEQYDAAKERQALRDKDGGGHLVSGPEKQWDKHELDRKILDLMQSPGNKRTYAQWQESLTKQKTAKEWENDDKYIISTYDSLQKLEGEDQAMKDDFGVRVETAEDRQRAQLAQIENSPEMQMMVEQAEEGMLANASATGGLRGGDTQRSLQQIRPQILNQLINQRVARLTGLTQMGQASAAGTGAAAMQTGAGVANAQMQGTVGAANARAQGQVAQAGAWNSIPQAVGSVGGQLLGHGLQYHYDQGASGGVGGTTVTTTYDNSEPGYHAPTYKG